MPRPEKPKPIQVERVVGRQIWRIPDVGFVTPRLQNPSDGVSAIGFTAELAIPEDDE